MYTLLREHLSKYVVAETVDDPASIPAPSPAAEAETAEDQAEAKADDNGNKTGEGAASTTVTAGEKTEVSDREADDEVGADETTTASPRKKKRKVGGGNGGQAPAVEKTAETTAEKSAEATTEKTAEENAVAAAAVKKPDPNGPKCVQLKMKPNWRRSGFGKRRRGDLDNNPGGGGRGGGRWAWPEGRPEYCRFVLYKENCDTVSGRNSNNHCGVVEWRVAVARVVRERGVRQVVGIRTGR